MHTLSFSILDDLQHLKVQTVEINDLSYDTIFNALKTIVSKIKYDPTYCFVGDSFINRITEELISDGYFVRNRVEKYYVIAAAIDYKRFEVYSKDCDKKVIKWRNNDEDDEVVHQIEDEDYNMNPVLKMMNSLQK